MANSITDYADAGAEVVVLAVSQDREPDDDTPLRALVEKTLDEKDFALNRPPVGLVALDPTGGMGDAFAVRALPTVVLLDKEGVVQSVHVGYRPGIVAKLRREIDSLLDGKSLLDDPDAKEKHDAKANP